MALLAIALLIDWWIGDPDWLWRRVKHPVALFGAVIDWFDLRRNALQSTQSGEGGEVIRPNISQIIMGTLLLVVFLVISVLAGWAVLLLTGFSLWIGGVVELVVIVVFLAQRSLRDHVGAVATALRSGGLKEGREAVALIVGRDVSRLGESGVSKAAIESLAENFSDGVAAPAFWYAIGGLPGLIFYKAVNTADSMIGHWTEQYEHFGKPAAKLDDWMNWIPARLSLLLVVGAEVIYRGIRQASTVWSVSRNNAHRHRSPNAGWPEAAFAASLGLRLGGPRNYGDEKVDGVVLNDSGREEATVDDIDHALDLFRGVCFLLFVIVVLLWLVLR